jgi:hypothetical protein
LTADYFLSILVREASNPKIGLLGDDLKLTDEQKPKFSHVAASLPSQQQMFPRRAVIEFPPKEHSADSMGEVEADDQHRYYVKGDVHGRPVRASEWLCTRIAEHVGIGAPTPVVVELLNGLVVFGSRRIPNVADGVVTQAYLTQPTASNIGQPPVGLGSILASIYAFDMFMYNVDRHLGNYLSVDDNGTRRVYSFDFSRALFWNWPWSGFPLPGQNTRQWGTVLRSMHGFDQQAAFVTLDRLSGLGFNTIDGFIKEMPPDWTPSDVGSQFHSFWSGNDRQSRIIQLRTGITDGTLL